MSLSIQSIHNQPVNCFRPEIQIALAGIGRIHDQLKKLEQSSQSQCSVNLLETEFQWVVKGLESELAAPIKKISRLIQQTRAKATLRAAL